MKVAVLGAGVVGVTPREALRWLFMKHAPLRLRPHADARTIVWLTKFLRNCAPARYPTNKRRMARLAEYSRDQLAQLRAETGIRYDERMHGTLQLFRTPSQFEAVATDVGVLRAEGVPFDVLDGAGCIAAEPGLAFAEARIAGGLRLPKDETGDCHKFTTALAALAEEAGVRFQFKTEVQALVASGGTIEGVLTSRGRFTADAFVVALGSFLPPLLRSLGLRLPVYPVKGSSITTSIRDRARAPVSTVLDETFKVAVTRLGDRIRVGGMAEVGGFDVSLPNGPRATLVHCLEGLFPGAGDTASATYWTGLRPMTPDGAPIIGRTAVKGLCSTPGTAHSVGRWPVGPRASSPTRSADLGRKSAARTWRCRAMPVEARVSSNAVRRQRTQTHPQPRSMRLPRRALPLPPEAQSRQP